MRPETPVCPSSNHLPAHVDSPHRKTQIAGGATHEGERFTDAPHHGPHARILGYGTSPFVLTCSCFGSSCGSPTSFLVRASRSVLKWCRRPMKVAPSAR